MDYELVVNRPTLKNSAFALIWGGLANKLGRAGLVELEHRKEK